MSQIDYNPKYSSTTDGTRYAVINQEGRLDVVQHAHPNNGTVIFTSPILSASQDFILIDSSDTVNYPHITTGYVHIESMFFEIDATSNALYEISIGFLNNIDDTNGDYYEVFSVFGSQLTGINKEIGYPVYPNGTRCQTESIATSVKSLNDTAFQTDVNLASTLDPSSVDTPSGNNDLVIRATVTAGSLIASVNLSYHAH